ncbi:3-hydroxybenzoate 6-hydroxylase [Pigmentiphaga humi]|uniref:3-hydroxybenzoate 6-hydroxylase n=1 Tax=Pigmentiphaga humi TaxID=2478468 RepID=A0A3P4B6M9_9BURK|nr:flavin-dependent oxidoreductase [Pigmentiphaga humi]VCU70835.1 3-hydroxybenzoate 6-hydroxylase [Pigmentiphaga humi]
MKVAIIGGGIGGLTLALQLHSRGIGCEVFEAVPVVKEIGVGITLLPHATKELAALGLLEELEALGIENEESVFYNRYGQFVYSEPRGRHAGYDVPELGMHRGKLHGVLYRAAVARLGENAVHTGFRAVRIEQEGGQAVVHFAPGPDGQAPAPVGADVVVACDGVNSAIRRQFYPDEQVAFGGINTWRGVTKCKPFLTGKSYVRAGTIDTGKMVIYPIVDNVDGQGNQLINWVAELRQADMQMNDWNKPGNAADIMETFKDWKFDWLDVAKLIEDAEEVLEYPMVDKDPVGQWTFGRVTLLGDAAHPMYPRGSNGSAQAILDARTLAECLAASPDDADAALAKYESARRPATARVVETNRTVPPDYIIMKVDELSGGKPFDKLDDLISQQELQAISDNYKQIAGFQQGSRAG